MAGMRDIAVSAGVSLETVSRILNGRYQGRTARSRELRGRVERLAGELGYRADTAARAMRTKSTGLIGLVVEESVLQTHPVITETMKGINGVLAEAGYVLTVSSLDGVGERTLDLRIFRERLLDGLFVIDNIAAEQAEMMRREIPACVTINGNEWRERGCVRRDELAAAATAAKELAGLGYRRAYYLELPRHPAAAKPYHYSHDDRRRGFVENFSGSGREVILVPSQTGYVLKFLMEAGGFLDNRTVVVASSTLFAHCAISALAATPWRVGRDFGLVCLDDESGFAASAPGLARVSFPRQEIGAAAAKIMVATLAGDRDGMSSTLFKGEWIAGDTAPPVAPVAGNAVPAAQSNPVGGKFRRQEARSAARPASLATTNIRKGARKCVG